MFEIVCLLLSLDCLKFSKEKCCTRQIHSVVKCFTYVWSYCIIKCNMFCSLLLKSTEPMSVCLFWREICQLFYVYAVSSSRQTFPLLCDGLADFWTNHVLSILIFLYIFYYMLNIMIYFKENPWCCEMWQSYFSAWYIFYICMCKSIFLLICLLWITAQ